MRDDRERLPDLFESGDRVKAMCRARGFSVDTRGAEQWTSDFLRRIRRPPSSLPQRAGRDAGPHYVWWWRASVPAVFACMKAHWYHLRESPFASNCPKSCLATDCRGGPL